MEKRPLILLSGGLDSTYNAYLHCKEGRRTDYVYCDGGQGQRKISVEKASIDKIRTWFSNELDCCPSDRRSPESKVVLANSPGVSWRQALPWFVCAMEVVDPERHSVVEISYVMGDEIGHAIPALKEAWAAVWKFAKQGAFVPLEFPLCTTSKQTILENMPAELYALTWVCELPNLDTLTGATPCDQCRACETRKIEEYRYQLRKGRSLADKHLAEIERNAAHKKKILEREEEVRRKEREVVGSIVAIADAIAEGGEIAIVDGENSHSWEPLHGAGDSPLDQKGSDVCLAVNINPQTSTAVALIEEA